MSDLVASESTGVLSREELVALVVNVIGGSVGSSRAGIANSILLMLQHPEQAEWTRSAPERIRPAVEECLRYHPPFRTGRRRARETNDQFGRAFRTRRHGSVGAPGGQSGPGTVGRARPVRRHATRATALQLRVGLPFLPRQCAGPPRHPGRRRHLSRAVRRRAVGRQPTPGGSRSPPTSSSSRWSSRCPSIDHEEADTMTPDDQATTRKEIVVRLLTAIADPRSRLRSRLPGRRRHVVGAAVGGRRRSGASASRARAGAGVVVRGEPLRGGNDGVGAPPDLPRRELRDRPLLLAGHHPFGARLREPVRPVVPIRRRC